MLQTHRLGLRPFELEDAEAFYELNKDKEVMQFTGDNAFSTVEAARSFISNYDHYEEFGFGRWTVVLIESDIVIGWCGLKQHTDYVDIGYRILRQFWNKGYATEAASACLEYGLKTLKIPLIVGRTARANEASANVLRKIGMEFWKEDTCEGLEDSVYYRVTRNKLA